MNSKKDKVGFLSVKLIFYHRYFPTSYLIRGILCVVIHGTEIYHVSLKTPYYVAFLNLLQGKMNILRRWKK